MEQQRGKGGAAGTGDVDHAVAEVLLSPALTCHPFDAFRVPAVPSYRHGCCLPLRLLCFPAPLAVLTVYRKVFLIVAAGHAFERCTRRGGSVEEEEEEVVEERFFS